MFKLGFAGGLTLAVAALLASAATATAGITYERQPMKLQPETQDSVTAKCPGGTHVLSGGVGLTDLSSVVVSSLPEDRGDADSEPDDGWTVTLANTSSLEDDRTKAHAVCATGPMPEYDVLGAVSTGTIYASQSCPPDTLVTGAGAGTQGAMGTTHVHTWAPFDYESETGAGATFVIEGSPAAPNFFTATVCTDEYKLRYPRKTITIQSPFGGTDPIFCRRRETVVGGGGYVADPGPGVEVRLVDAFPDDRPNEPGKRTEDGWAISFFPDPSTAEPSAEMVAACAK